MSESLTHDLRFIEDWKKMVESIKQITKEVVDKLPTRCRGDIDKRVIKVGHGNVEIVNQVKLKARVEVDIPLVCKSSGIERCKC